MNERKERKLQMLHVHTNTYTPTHTYIFIYTHTQGPESSGPHEKLFKVQTDIRREQWLGAVKGEGQEGRKGD